MMKRFSDMSKMELYAEIERLADAIEHCDTESEREVYRQKRLMARSYAVKGLSFPPGEYRVEGTGALFHLRYLNGVMAWGVWDNGEEAAVPLAALEPASG